jgi:hypothetical protein
MLLATAYAQEPDPAYSHIVALPGINTEVRVFAGAPAGFDPAAASDEELMTYGYPRRPDPSDTRAFSVWLKSVSTKRITPELSVNLSKNHSLNHKPFSAVKANSVNQAEGDDVSGYSLLGGSPKFDETVGDWIVPSVNAQFEKFSGYSSMSVSLDGNCNCNDSILAGTEQDSVKETSSYYAWIEFSPLNEVEIKNLTVQPGDVIAAYVSMEVKSGKTYGVYYIANLNSTESVSATILMPSGVTYVGAAANWFLQRPNISGVSDYYPTPNFAYAFMTNAWAYRTGSTKKITYLSEKHENITMEDTKGKKSVKAYELDSISMWFEWLNY